ncbi:MAG: recombinase family protein [Clostridia bacterium]
MIESLIGQGITVHILNLGIMDNTPTGKLMVTMLLAFAEFEHDQIIDRLSTGKAVAKLHGKRTDGRYKKCPTDFETFLKLQQQGKITVNDACTQMGICRTTWYKLSNECATA